MGIVKKGYEEQGPVSVRRKERLHEKKEGQKKQQGQVRFGDRQNKEKETTAGRFIGEERMKKQ